MKLPKDLKKLIQDRGHVRNLFKLLPSRWPEVQKALGRSKLPIAEFMYLEMGNKIGKCPCGKPTKFKNFAQGYKETCSLTCPENRKLWAVRKKKTMLSRHGVEHSMQSPKVKEKMQSTMIERYGAKTTLESKVLRAKAEKTCQKNHGADFFFGSEEYRKMQTPEKLRATQKVREATMVERYGVLSPMQIPEVQRRQQETAMLFKTVRVGHKTFRVRGYEDQALVYLHKEKGVPVKSIRVAADHDIPTIHYSHKGKPRWYFPDIMLVKPGRSVLIEVKSIFTLARSKEDAHRIEAKFKAAAKEHEFWLLLIHKGQFVMVKNPARFTVKQLLARVGVNPPPFL